MHFSNPLQIADSQAFQSIRGRLQLFAHNKKKFSVNQNVFHVSRAFHLFPAKIQIALQTLQPGCLFRRTNELVINILFAKIIPRKYALNDKLFISNSFRLRIE